MDVTVDHTVFPKQTPPSRYSEDFSTHHLRTLSQINYRHTHLSQYIHFIYRLFFHFRGPRVLYLCAWWWNIFQATQRRGLNIAPCSIFFSYYYYLAKMHMLLHYSIFFPQSMQRESHTKMTEPSRLLTDPQL